MDTHCRNCREPWDHDYLRHSVWLDFRVGELTELQLKILNRAVNFARFRNGVPDVAGYVASPLFDEHFPDVDRDHVSVNVPWIESKVADMLRREGWGFGGGPTSVMYCPCCDANLAGTGLEDDELYFYKE